MVTIRRPYRLVLSVYGAAEASYDSLTRRRGAFKAFTKGLSAAHEAGLSINLNLVVTRHNEHDVDQMRALAESYGVSYATDEGIDGLRKLGDIADSLMLRTGGCSGCALSKKWCLSMTSRNSAPTRGAPAPPRTPNPTR